MLFTIGPRTDNNSTVPAQGGESWSGPSYTTWQWWVDSFEVYWPFSIRKDNDNAPEGDELSFGPNDELTLDFGETDLSALDVWPEEIDASPQGPGPSPHPVSRRKK